MLTAKPGQPYHCRKHPAKPQVIHLLISVTPKHPA
jgi:hypothetical protein